MADVNIIISSSGQTTSPGEALVLAYESSGNRVDLSLDSSVGITSYEWELIDQPEGVEVSLVGASTATPYFTSAENVDGTYLIECRVNGEDTGRSGIAYLTPNWDLRKPAIGELDEFADYGWADSIRGTIDVVDTYLGTDISISEVTNILNLTQLRLFEGTSENQLIYLVDHTFTNDGGGGWFSWDSDSTETDNNGTIIQVTGVVTGRWERVYSGAVNVRWFGATGDGSTNDTAAIQAAIDVLSSGGTLFFPSGDYYVTTADDNLGCLYISVDDVRVIGEGRSSIIRTKSDRHIALHFCKVSNDTTVSTSGGDYILGTVVEDVCFIGTGTILSAGDIATNQNWGRLLFIRRYREAIVQNCFVYDASLCGITLSDGESKGQVINNICGGCRGQAININARGAQSIIDNNIVYGPTGSATVEGSSIQIGGHCIVTNNTIYGDHTDYAYVGGILVGEGNWTNLSVISNNLIKHCRYGIKVQYHGPISAHSNTIVNCMTLAGIYVVQGTTGTYTVEPKYSDVSNNKIINCGQSGIWLSTDQCHCTGNHIVRISSPVNPGNPTDIDGIIDHQATYGIYLRSGENTTVQGNTIDGAQYGITVREDLVSTVGLIDDNNILNYTQNAYAVLDAGLSVVYSSDSPFMFRTIDAISDLADHRYLAVSGAKVSVLGYSEAGDGGGGEFYWDSTSTESDDGGTIIQVDGITTGRWKRQYSGAVNVRWFGATGDGVTDDTAAIQAAVTAASNGSTILFPQGDYQLDGTVTLSSKNQIKFIAHGATITQTANDTTSLTIDGCEEVVVEGGKFVGVGTDYNDGTDTGGGTGIGIYDSSKVTVRDVDFYLHGYAGVSLQTGDISDISVINCRIEGTGEAIGITPMNIKQFGVYCSGSITQTGFLRLEGCEITRTCQGIFAAGSGWDSFSAQHNFIHDIDGQHAFYIDFVRRVNVSNNIIRECYRAGVKYQLTTDTVEVCRSITISNNTIEECGIPIAILRGTSDAWHTVRNVTIEGNTIWCSKDRANSDSLIDVAEVLNCSITGNDLRNSPKYSINAEGNGLIIANNNCTSAELECLRVVTGKYDEAWSGGGSYETGNIVLGSDDKLYDAIADGGEAEDPTVDTDNTYWRCLDNLDVAQVHGNTFIDACRSNPATLRGILLNSEKDNGKIYIHNNVMLEGELDLTYSLHSYSTVDLYMWGNQFSSSCGMIRVDGALRTKDPINVKWFGATGDGSTDDYTAIQAAIDAAPDFDTTWSSSSKPAGGTTILFPETSDSYVIGTKLNVPNTKSVSFEGAGHQMTRLEYTGTGDYCINIDGAQRPISFEKLLFDGGGIEFEGNCRISNVIRDCMFMEIDDYAIKVLGASCVSFEIAFCTIGYCAGGVSIGYSDCDLWNIHHCNFIRNDADIYNISSGVRVNYCNFETRTIANVANPNIHFAAGTYNCWITNNRFGGETDGSTHNPPTYNIVVGPLTSTSTSSSTRIKIHGNDFLGTTGTPSATIANSPIKFSCPNYKCIVTENNFVAWAYYSNMVEEAYFDNTGPKANYLYGNIWKDNAVSYRGDNRIFSQEGVGWITEDHQVTEDSRRNATNYLTANITSWTNINTTDAKDATGPDGVASSAWTITKSAAANAYMNRYSSSNIGGDGDYVYSVWLKAGTTNRARIFAIDGGDQLSSILESIVLTDEWVRYHVVLSNVASSTSANCYIGIGHDDDASNLNGSTILAYGPQLEKGRVPSEYLYSSDTEHAARQLGGQSLGNIYVGYGTAAPTSGRYEVGDRIYNTSPSTSEIIDHWLCTTAGSPGTWQSQYVTTSSSIHVSHYGATGDGSTDDATAIQNAIDAADGKQWVEFEAFHTYCVGTEIDLLTGTGTRGSRIKGNFAVIKATSSIDSVLNLEPSVLIEKFQIRDLDIDANSNATYGLELHRVGEQLSSVSDVRVRGATSHGVVLRKCETANFNNILSRTNGGDGFLIEDCNGSFFNNIGANDNTGDGITVQNDTYTGGCQFVSLVSQLNDGHGVHIVDTTSPVTIQNGWIENNALDGIRIGASVVGASVRDVGIIGGEATDSYYAVRLLSGAEACEIIGNKLQIKASGGTVFDQVVENNAIGVNRIYPNYERNAGGTLGTFYAHGIESGHVSGTSGPLSGGEAISIAATTGSIVCAWTPSGTFKIPGTGDRGAYMIEIDLVGYFSGIDETCFRRFHAYGGITSGTMYDSSINDILSYGDATRRGSITASIALGTGDTMEVTISNSDDSSFDGFLSWRTMMTTEGNLTLSIT